MSARALAAALLAPFLLAGCLLTGGGDDDYWADDDDDDDTSCGPVGVDEVCETVIACDAWGWESMSQCLDGFLDNPEYMTECENTVGYLCCVPECLALDCAGFIDCEPGCWTDYCM